MVTEANGCCGSRSHFGAVSSSYLRFDDSLGLLHRRQTRGHSLVFWAPMVGVVRGWGAGANQIPSHAPNSRFDSNTHLGNHLRALAKESDAGQAHRPALVCYLYALARGMLEESANGSPVARCRHRDPAHWKRPSRSRTTLWDDPLQRQVDAAGGTEMLLHEISQDCSR